MTRRIATGCHAVLTGSRPAPTGTGSTGAVVAAILSALVALGLGAVSAAPAQAATACRVDYAIAGQWDGGFQGSVTLTNLGDPLSTWSLQFQFPDGGQRLSQGWSASWSQSGAQVTAVNAAWNGALPTGASAAIGFIGSFTGANPVPTGFTVNGVPCGGAPSSTSSASTSWTATSTTSQTTSIGQTTSTRTSTTSSQAGCPHAGRITYTLQRASNPTEAQAEAYRRITAAMDRAVSFYNCHASISKSLTVQYAPSVPTADANYNGTLRFGSTGSMQHITAMHEIAHTVGVGTVSAWSQRLSNGAWTGSSANSLLRSITGNPSATIRGDSQHFWPYGLNYTSEVSSDADLINHVRIVAALRQDMGLQ